VAPNSPSGTDITAVYAFADSSNLYIGIRVLGDTPNRNVTFTVEIKTDSGRYHVAVRRNGTQCSCWQEPWKEGNIYFDCRYALEEIVEMQVPLEPLESPETIYLSNIWVWQESTQRDFDSYDGPSIKIPSLGSFEPETKLEIEKTETTYTTATAIGPLSESSLVYVAVISTFVVLGVFMYWRKVRPRRPEAAYSQMINQRPVFHSFNESHPKNKGSNSQRRTRRSPIPILIDPLNHAVASKCSLGASLLWPIEVRYNNILQNHS